MNTKMGRMVRHAVGVAAALVVVTAGAAALDQAHIASAPGGTVEVGPFEVVSIGTPATVGQVATLPEVTVVASRIDVDGTKRLASSPVTLPEVVVSAKREAGEFVHAAVAVTVAVSQAAEGALLQ